MMMSMSVSLWFDLWAISTNKKKTIGNEFDLLLWTESGDLEETVCDIQLLLSTENLSSFLHFLLLLHRSSYERILLRSQHSHLVNYLRSFCDHFLYCHCHAKVSTTYFRITAAFSLLYNTWGTLYNIYH